MESWIKDALPDAVAYASSLLGQRDQGEDIVQDCVCRLLANAERYDLARDGRKLLFRAIYHACVNLRTRRRPQVGLDQQGAYDTSGTRRTVTTTAASPPEAAITAELRLAIVEGLGRLTLPYRSVLELSSLGYKPMEVAEMLDLDAHRVRVLLFRARKMMAAWLNSRFPT